MRLAAYRWPGNVRELRNVVQRAYVMATEPVIVDACAAARQRADAPEAPAPAISVRIGTSLAEAERQVTLATLEHFGRHKERTAATLGVSLKTLYNRLKEYAVTEGEPNSQPAALDESH